MDPPDSLGLPGQGEKCASGCRKSDDELEIWESSYEPSESDGCCAPGLVCDKVTSTCEVALGQSCEAPTTTTTTEPQKGFFKRNFQKIIRKKKPEMEMEAAEPQKCAKYFERHGTECISGECCVKSFYLQDIPDKFMVKIIVSRWRFETAILLFFPATSK